MCKLDVIVEFEVRASLLLRVEQMILNRMFMALPCPIQNFLLEVRCPGWQEEGEGQIGI